jgi:hypothetical protein
MNFERLFVYRISLSYDSPGVDREPLEREFDKPVAQIVAPNPAQAIAQYLTTIGSISRRDPLISLNLSLVCRGETTIADKDSLEKLV